MQSYRRRVVCTIGTFPVDSKMKCDSVFLRLHGVAIRCHATQGDNLPRKGTECGRRSLVSPTPAEVAPSNALVPLAYTVDEVATALRVSPRTIRNLLREGELVRRKVGSRTIIPRTSVEAFLRKDHATGEGKRKVRRKKHGRS